MNPLKALGPDIMSDFFQELLGHNWPKRGGVRARLLSDKQICLKLKPFFIFISKKENPKVVDHFSPVSLCNFAYKVLSKMLANRMKTLLDGLISPFQSAFVLGRWIAEGPVLAQEVMQVFRRKQGKSSLVGIKMADLYNLVLHSTK